MLNEFNAYHPINGMEISVKPDGFIRFHEKDKDGGLSVRIKRRITQEAA